MEILFHYSKFNPQTAVFAGQEGLHSNEVSSRKLQLHHAKLVMITRASIQAKDLRTSVGIYFQKFATEAKKVNIIIYIYSAIILSCYRP